MLSLRKVQVTDRTENIIIHWQNKGKIDMIKMTNEMKAKLLAAQSAEEAAALLKEVGID